MGSKTRRLRVKARPVYLLPEHIREVAHWLGVNPPRVVVDLPPRTAMSALVGYSLLASFARRDSEALLVRSRHADSPPGHARTGAGGPHG